MTAKVLPKKTVTAGKVPSTTDLVLGEIAINYEDGVLYGRHPNGTIVNLTGALELHNHSISQVTGLQAALAGKVDDSQVLTNVPSGAVFTDTKYSAGNGISLSGTTFTNTAPHVATNLSYTPSTRLLQSSTGANVTLPRVTTTTDGLMIAADKTKLNGIAIGATSNSSDAQLRDRSTHTGTQAVDTVLGLRGELDDLFALSFVL